MEQEGTRTLPLIRAYSFGAEHGLEQEVEAIRNMELEWDLSYGSSVRRGYMVELFEAKGLMQSFMEQHWPIGLTDFGARKRNFFLRIKQRYEDFLVGREPVEGEEEEIEAQEQQFVAESDLRNVLVGNLESVEPGLKLFEREGRSGMEYPIDGGRIDILAVDREGKLVVIELKLSKGRNRALGQILYYMGWVDANLGNGPCRGVIIAKEIPDDLVLASKRVPGVSLRRYILSISTEPVG